MKKKLLFFATFFAVICVSAQKNFIDQPFVETAAKADTLIVPDRIYITINLNEADSKNKKSVEEQERLLESTLKKLNINPEKDLSLLDFSSNFKQYFIKGQNVVKSKLYSLIVRDALTAGKVLAELENVGVSNVNIDRTEYSKGDELLQILKTEAVVKAQENALLLAQSLGQVIGKAIFISDSNSVSNAIQGQAPGVMLRGMSSLYGNRADHPIFIEAQKVRFEVEVNAKFLLD